MIGLKNYQYKRKLKSIWDQKLLVPPQIMIKYLFFDPFINND